MTSNRMMGICMFAGLAGCFSIRDDVPSESGVRILGLRPNASVPIDGEVAIAFSQVVVLAAETGAQVAQIVGDERAGRGIGSALGIRGAQLLLGFRQAVGLEVGGAQFPVQLRRTSGAQAIARRFQQLERVTHLVRLQVTDEVPLHGPADLRDLVARFLHPVLAQSAEAGGDRGADAPHVDSLRHADQQHVLGAPTGPLSRTRDALAHALEIGADILHNQQGDSSTRLSATDGGRRTSRSEGGDGDEAAAIPLPI